MRFITAALFCLAASVAAAADHPCKVDAEKRAGRLLQLHWNDDGGNILTETPNAKNGEGRQSWALDELKLLEPVKALVGKGRFDVLELTGSIYKANYRMRFLYAQIPDSCVLMGQEIIEIANPY
jgi:hypothetical protein